jgi:hypothetical protein
VEGNNKVLNGFGKYPEQNNRVPNIMQKKLTLKGHSLNFRLKDLNGNPVRCKPIKNPYPQ